MAVYEFETASGYPGTGFMFPLHMFDLAAHLSVSQLHIPRSDLQAYVYVWLVVVRVPSVKIFTTSSLMANGVVGD